MFAPMRKMIIFASDMANTELRIKEICKEKGITLEQLAKRLGILRTSLAQAMSRNSFSIERLAQIADALETDIPSLFKGEQEAPPTIICPHCGKTIHIKTEK